MRLLVTRPEPDAGLFADDLRALGHEAVLQPLLEYRARDFDTSLLRSANALVITSRNALRALQDKVDIQNIANVTVYCVGGETAKLALAAGFRSVSAIADTVSALAPKIVSHADCGTELLHVSGEHQAFDLSGALAREGLSVRTLRVYEMGACRALAPGVVARLRAGEIDGVLLMSPRTAEIFISLCRAHDLVDEAKALCYFCIAESVAGKIRPLGAKQVRVAAVPNRNAILDLVARSDSARPFRSRDKHA
jgi:uroporphyrinogen-III synthase